MVFIALEGLPGSGKTTIRQEVIRALETSGVYVWHVGQHGWLSVAAARVIVNARRGSIQLSPGLLVSALIGDKSLHYKHNVAPFVNQGVVLADRYSVSDLLLLAAVSKHDIGEYLLNARPEAKPDVTFIIDCSSDTVRRRMGERPSSRFLDTAEALSAASRVLETDLPEKVSGKTVRVANELPGDIAKCRDLIIKELGQAVLGTQP